MPELEKDGWELESAEERHRANPDRFEIPTREQRASLLPGKRVKLLFLIAHQEHGNTIVNCERMWVAITAKTVNGYVGRLESQPATSSVLKPGQMVEFGPEHIATVMIARTKKA